MLDNFEQPQPQARVEVVKAIFKETGTYNDMTIRPFQTNFTPTMWIFSTKPHKVVVLSRQATCPALPPTSCAPVLSSLAL